MRYGLKMADGAVLDEYNIYALIGEEGFERLVAARSTGGFRRTICWARCMQAATWKEAEQRLRDFLVVRFGGPSRYLEQRGHPRLRMRHATFPIDQRARDRWLHLMGAAFEAAKLPAEAERVLRTFFESTASFLMQQRGSHKRPVVSNSFRPLGASSWLEFCFSRTSRWCPAGCIAI